MIIVLDQYVSVEDSIVFVCVDLCYVVEVFVIGLPVVRGIAQVLEAS